MSTADAIGFIGCGSMGAAIAERFLAAGIDLTVFDLDPGNVAPLVAAGARPAGSPRAVADRAAIVIACLPTTAASLAVALGDDGVAGGGAIRVLVDTSTIGTAVAERIADALPPHIGFLDAPVSGGPPGARTGTLTTMASGPRAVFDRAAPALRVMARHVFHVGERAGRAQIAKLINNNLSAAGRLAAFEGLVLGLKAGVDPHALFEMINVSSGRNYTTTDKIPAAILSGTFRFNGRLAISIKDETLLMEEAAALGVPLWVAPRLLETLKAAGDDGYLDQDSMLLVQYMGEQAGIDVRAMLRDADPAAPDPA